VKRFLKSVSAGLDKFIAVRISKSVNSFEVMLWR